MSRITTVKDKIPKKASWPGFLASGKDSRTKVVLARKLEKQGLGSTPAFVMLTLWKSTLPRKGAGLYKLVAGTGASVQRRWLSMGSLKSQ